MRKGKANFLRWKMGEKVLSMGTYALFSLGKFWKNKYFKNQAKF